MNPGIQDILIPGLLLSINRSADLFFYTINRHLVAPPRHRFSDKPPDFPTVRQPIVVEALRPLFLT